MQNNLNTIKIQSIPIQILKKINPTKSIIHPIPSISIKSNQNQSKFHEKAQIIYP